MAGDEFDSRESFLRIHYSMAMLKKGKVELTLESFGDCTEALWFGELHDVSVPEVFEFFKRVSRWTKSACSGKTAVLGSRDSSFSQSDWEAGLGSGSGR